MTLLPIFVEQYKESREQTVGTDSVSKTLVYKITADWYSEAIQRDFGTLTEYNDDDLVHQAIYENFPWYREFPIQDGLFLLLILSSVSIKQINDDTWEATLVYELPETTQSFLAGDLSELYKDYNLGPDKDENGGAGWSDQLTQLSFNSSVNEVHKTTSRFLRTKHKADWLPAGVAVPNNMVVNRPAPVGTTKDEIKGYNVFEREFKFQITQYFTPQRLKYSYVRTLYRLTGTLNSTVFFGFPAGSVLFMGASAEGDYVQNVPVTFEFAVRPNFHFVTTGTVLSDPNVDDPALMFDKLSDPTFADTTGLGAPYSGWSIVDYRYLPTPDADAKTIMMRPAFRFIHEAYEYMDFAKLQL